MALAIESIVEGLELPVFTREGTLLHWVHYAAVNPAHIVGHHLDDEVGRREGFAAAFIMAPLEHAYLHAMLRQWMEGRGRVHRLDIRLRRPLLRGRWLTAGGTVTEVRQDADRMFVQIYVWEKDDLGELLAPGQADVSFPIAAT